MQLAQTTLRLETYVSATISSSRRRTSNVLFLSAFYHVLRARIRRIGQAFSRDLYSSGFWAFSVFELVGSLAYLYKSDRVRSRFSASFSTSACVSLSSPLFVCQSFPARIPSLTVVSSLALFLLDTLRDAETKSPMQSTYSADLLSAPLFEQYHGIKPITVRFFPC